MIQKCGTVKPALGLEQGSKRLFQQNKGRENHEW